MRAARPRGPSAASHAAPPPPPLLLVLIIALHPRGTLAETRWATAGALKSGIENILSQQVMEMQAEFRRLDALDASTPISCAGTTAHTFCDAQAAAFQEGNPLLLKEAQHSDEATGTCSAIDLDICGYPLPAAVTGRKVQGSASEKKENCRAPSVKKCGGWFEYASENRATTLDDQDCTSDEDLGKCYMNVDPSFLGYTYPDASQYTITERRPQLELCVGNHLVQLPSNPTYSIAAVKAEYPQTNAAFGGMQATGLYRSWPGLYQCRTENQCSGCSDPRFRGWYASAATGAKDVVVVIDVSGSMLESNRMEYAKVAADWVINTLSEYDYAMVVAFNNDASSPESTLLRMTAQNRAELKAFIAGLSAGGGTDFENGFELAFEILQDSSAEDETSSGCNSVILFMTDGQAANPSAIVNSFNGGPYHSNNPRTAGGQFTRIFTYAFGSGSETEAMRRIACDNGGVFHKISDTDGPRLKEVMANYYSYLASGLVFWNEYGVPPIKWVDVWEDGQGRGKLAGACGAAFDFGNDPPFLLGIQCLSTGYYGFQKLSDFDATWESIENDRRKCAPIQLTWAQLENLRSKSKYTYTCDAAVQGTSPGNPAVNNAVEENCPCSFQKKINYHFSGGGYGDYDEDLCDLDEGGSCCGWGPAVYFFTNDVWPGESCSITLKGAGWWIYLFIIIGCSACGALLYKKQKEYRERRKSRSVTVSQTRATQESISNARRVTLTTQSDPSVSQLPVAIALPQERTPVVMAVAVPSQGP